MPSWLEQYSLPPRIPAQTVGRTPESAAAEQPHGAPGIVYLENSDFDDRNMLREHSRFVVLVTSPSCHYCTEFWPVFAQFAGMAPQLGVTAAVIERGNSVDSIDLFARASQIFPGMRGFPSVFLFEGGRVSAQYTGPRTLESLITFAQYK